jgi:hypothetical protein
MSQPPGDPEPLMPFDEGAAQPQPYQPYPGGQYVPPPVYARPVKPLGSMATTTSILLGIASAASLAVAFPHFNRASVVAAYLTKGSTLADVNHADSQVVLFTALFGLIVLATAVLFMIWQHGLASNAQALGGELSLGPGWAIGGWFIPLANLVIPQLQMRQSATVSGRPPGVLVAWNITFAAAVLGNAISNVTQPRQPSGFSNAQSLLDSFAQADRIAGVSMIVYALAGVLAILMVQTLTKRQQETAATRQQPQTYGY